MATQITNKATLNYNSGEVPLTTSSNTATVTMHGPLEVTKHSLQSSYRIGEELTYNIFVTNTSGNALANVTVVDDLGTYTLPGTTPGIAVTPLTYMNPAKLFLNNALQGTLDGVVSLGKDKVTFTLESLAGNTTALIQYKAIANEFIAGSVGVSQIKNTVLVTADNIAETVDSSNTLPVASYALVTIEKSMSPDPVVDGSLITYTFHIHNYGNIDATNVILRDAFTTLPSISSVHVDGVKTELPDYSYVEGVFQYPSDESALTYTIGAAEIRQDARTGVVTVIPKESIVVITGTI